MSIDSSRHRIIICVGLEGTFKDHLVLLWAGTSFTGSGSSESLMFDLIWYFYTGGTWGKKFCQFWAESTVHRERQMNLEQKIEPHMLQLLVRK